MCDLSRVMRKPDFSLCENKGADQLYSKIQVDNDQEKAQPERHSHSKNPGEKNYIDN